MTVCTFKNLICDGDGTGELRDACQIEFQDMYRTANELRKKAAKQGWVRRSGRDICPGCWSEIQKDGKP
jgi:hypothetical protein